MAAKRRGARSAEDAVVRLARNLAHAIWVRKVPPLKYITDRHDEARQAAWRAVFARYNIPFKPIYLDVVAEMIADDYLPEFRKIRQTAQVTMEQRAVMVFEAIDILLARQRRTSNERPSVTQAIDNLFNGEHQDVHGAVRKAYTRYKLRVGQAR